MGLGQARARRHALHEEVGKTQRSGATAGAQQGRAATVNKRAGIGKGRDHAHGNVEDRAGTRAHDLRAGYIDRARDSHDTDRTECVGRANDRADIAGIAPLSEHDDRLTHLRLRQLARDCLHRRNRADALRVPRQGSRDLGGHRVHPARGAPGDVHDIRVGLPRVLAHVHVAHRIRSVQG